MLRVRHRRVARSQSQVSVTCIVRAQRLCFLAHATNVAIGQHRRTACYRLNSCRRYSLKEVSGCNNCIVHGPLPCLIQRCSITRLAPLLDKAGHFVQSNLVHIVAVNTCACLVAVSTVVQLHEVCKPGLIPAE